MSTQTIATRLTAMCATENESAIESYERKCSKILLAEIAVCRAAAATPENTRRDTWKEEDLLWEAILRLREPDWMPDQRPRFEPGLVEAIADEIIWAYTEGICYMVKNQIGGRILCAVPWAYASLKAMRRRGGASDGCAG